MEQHLFFGIMYGLVRTMFVWPCSLDGFLADSSSMPFLTIWYLRKKHTARQTSQALSTVQLAYMHTVHTDWSVCRFHGHGHQNTLNVIDGCTLAHSLNLLCLCSSVDFSQWSFWHLFRIQSMISCGRIHRLVNCSQFIAKTNDKHTRILMSTMMMWSLRSAATHTHTLRACPNEMEYGNIEKAVHDIETILLAASDSCIISSDSLVFIYKVCFNACNESNERQ